MSSSPLRRSLPLAPILARVSRSFYLTLRLLPAPTRSTVALAYLLARAADTVADTRLVAPPERERLLAELVGLFRGERSGDARSETLEELRSLSRSDDVIPEEKALLVETATLLEMLAQLSEGDRALVLRVLEVLTGGMREDLRRFPGETREELRALETREELRRYCYQVAGCVGEFWSELHALRLPSCRRVDAPAWGALGVELGLALQMTNVLRDLPRDLEHGRCYLPRVELAAAGIEPTELLAPATWPRLRPLYMELVGEALEEARAGLRHVLWTPSREVSLRLAALLPLLLAVRTLGVVVSGNPLDPASPRKVTRRVVYGILARGYLAARDDRAIVRLFKQTLRQSSLA